MSFHGVFGHYSQSWPNVPWLLTGPDISKANRNHNQWIFLLQLFIFVYQQNSAEYFLKYRIHFSSSRQIIKPIFLKYIHNILGWREYLWSMPITFFAPTNWREDWPWVWPDITAMGFPRHLLLSSAFTAINPYDIYRWRVKTQDTRRSCMLTTSSNFRKSQNCEI